MHDHDLNAQVFLALRNAGADFDLPHRVEHVIIGASERLHEIESHLASLGFEVVYQEPRVLTAMQWMALDINEMNERTVMLAKLASRYSCQYDGWETVPRRKCGSASGITTPLQLRPSERNGPEMAGVHAGLRTMNGDKLVTLIDQEPSEAIWKEAIDLSEFIDTQYDMVCEATLMALRKARHQDTIAALATCLLEHLFEHDFSFFDTAEQRILAGDSKLLFALSRCSKFGMATKEVNSRRWDALLLSQQGRLRRARRRYSSRTAADRAQR